MVHSLVQELDSLMDQSKGRWVGTGNTAIDAIDSYFAHDLVEGPVEGPKYDPPHYQKGKIQVWDFIADQKLDFFKGNVVKYVCRAGTKSGETELDDLMKAKVYVEKAIELLAL